MQTTKNSLNDAPEGTLRLSSNKNKVQYYHSKKDGKYNGTYIPKSEQELAQRLAQKDYDEKVLLRAQKPKTERSIADFLYKNNIPYKYEYPLYLKGFGTVYPDFTILSKKKRKLIYWEHDGKMDDPEYAIGAIKKIQTYENNGITLGDNLIVTFETSKTVLNTSSLERIIQSI